MNVGSILDYCRYLKGKLLGLCGSKRIFTVGDIVELTGANTESVPNLDLKRKLTLFCCYHDWYVKDSVYVLYDEFDEINADRAMRAGAYAILSSRQVKDYPCLIVPNPKEAVLKISQLIWSKINIPTVVVAGSCGKTTTKLFVGAVLSEKYRTFHDFTNINFYTYLAQLLQRFDLKAERFVAEVDESQQKNTYYTSQLFQPKVACITNIDKSHIGALGGLQNVIKSITEIESGLPEDGIVVINDDDEQSHLATFHHQVLRCSIKNRKADCYADNIVEKNGHVFFDLTYMGTEKCQIELPVPGKHNVYNAMMAFIAGKYNGLTTEQIMRGLMKYRPTYYRQNLIKSILSGNRWIYADCYNASATSIAAALEVANHMELPTGASKVAVLGDIAEIEGFEEQTYTAVADCLNASTIDVLITSGQTSQMIWPRLKRHFEGAHAKSRRELYEMVAIQKRRAGFMLFKASHSMKYEEVIRKTFPLVYYFKIMLPTQLKYFFCWIIPTL